MSSTDLIKPNQAVDVSYFVRTKFTELTLGLENGLRMFVKQWGDEFSAVRVLALHGWLDSSATWDKLAPLLVSNLKVGIRLVCIDFSSHGRSSHKSKDAEYNTIDRVFEVAAVADVLGWEKFVLMGHSMGAAVATLFAGAAPERVEKLILVDGLGSWPSPLSAAETLSVALKARAKLLRRQRRVYPSREIAIQRYMSNNPYMKEESARILVTAGTEEVEVWDSSSADGAPTETKSKDVGYVFRHDPRLTAISTIKYSESDNIDICKRIEAPTLLFLATNPLRRDLTRKSVAWMQPTYSKRLAVMKDVTVQFVESSHHLHLDSADCIFKSIVDFLVDPALLPQRGKPISWPVGTPASKL